jgi:hypothetical protein
MIAPAIVDRMIDSFVTPQALVATRKAEASATAPAEVHSPRNFNEEIQSVQHLRRDQIKYAFFSGGPLTFKVELLPDNDPPLHNPVTLLFQWNGDWRLGRVILPADAIGELAAEAKTDRNSISRPNPRSALAPAPPPETSSEPPPPASAPRPSISSEPPPLGVTLSGKGFKNRNIAAGDFQDDITIALSIQNVTDQDIRAFDGVLTFTDLLDNDLLSSKIAINELIKSHRTLNWKGSIKYNQFMDEHQRLRNERQENLKVKFQTNKVLFADGSSKQY